MNGVDTMNVKDLYAEIDRLKEDKANLERRQGVVSLATHEELKEDNARLTEEIRQRDQRIKELEKEVRTLTSEIFALKRKLEEVQPQPKRQVGRPAKEEGVDIVRELRRQGMSIRDIQRELLTRGINISLATIHKVIKGGISNEV